MSRLLALAAAACLAAGPLLAWGDPTRRATRLDPLVLDAEKGFSIARYEVQSGVYYRWRIRSDGRDSYRLVAPRLFRESWIDRVSIDDREVEPYGLHALGFDDAGEIDLWFVPIRPGRYDFYAEGLETQGFRGVFVVK